MTDETRPDEAAAGAGVAEETAEEQETPKLNQRVELQDVGPCKKHIKVTIERDSIDERLEQKFTELRTEANVSGFRPGKAPRKIIERRFHKDVADQVKNELLFASLEQLAEEHDLAPLAPPNVDPFKLELPETGPFVYEFDVEVRPEFDLPNYRGLKLKRPVRDFTDEDVAREENRVLAPYGQIVPKPEGNAQLGDIIVADITSKEGDHELSRFKEFSVRIEPKLAFKDGVAERFGEQLKGANTGDRRVVDIALSSATAVDRLRGQTIQTIWEIKDVKTLRLPELTPEFLHNFGVRSEEQMRELIRVLLQRRLEYEQRQSARRQVLEQISAASQWQLPEEMLMRQARKALQRRIMEMQAQGIKEDEIRGRIRILEQDVLQTTALALKEHFVLQKIAELEKIDVNEDDLDAEIERIAEQNNESPRRLRARIEREDLLDALAAEIIERRALDLILESAEYEDVPVGQPDQGAVATVDEQTVPGEMKDLTTPPPEPEAKTESPAEAAQS
jgi:trigger factor